MTQAEDKIWSMMMVSVWNKVSLRYYEVMKQKCPTVSQRDMVRLKTKSWVGKQIWRGSVYQ